MTYRYMGGPRPAVPGVPPRDLTDEEYAVFAAEHGQAALGAYRKGEAPSVAPEPEPEPEE